MQLWKNNIVNSSKGISYRIFKESIKLEKYVTSLPHKYSIIICQFISNNFKLPIEVGMWSNIPREQKFVLCAICRKSEMNFTTYLNIHIMI